MSDDNDFSDIAEDLVDVITEAPAWLVVTGVLLIIGIIVICII